MSLEISQNLQENTCAIVSFLIKRRACNFIKKRLWDRCFPVNFAKLLRAPFLTEHLWWLLLTCAFEEIWPEISVNLTEQNNFFSSGAQSLVLQIQLNKYNLLYKRILQFSLLVKLNDPQLSIMWHWAKATLLCFIFWRFHRQMPNSGYVFIEFNRSRKVAFKKILGISCAFKN